MEGYNYMLFKSEYRKVDKSTRIHSTLVLFGLALITRTILFFAEKNPFLVEKLYSSTVYLYIARGIGFISNIAPFSIAEMLLILITFSVMIIIFIIVLKPKFFLKNIRSILHHIIRFLLTMYILFYFLWGFNYYREDYSIIVNMTEEPARFSELRELTLEIIKKSNAIREVLIEDESGIFLVEESFQRLGEIANKGFDNYYIGDLNLGGNFGKIKPVFLSKYMSYTGITGIYIPFTSEPTINVDIPYQNLLSTISHEIAHQRGFAKEEEANFIAYKANVNNPDERFQYSGYYLAMTYLMNEIYRESIEDYFLLYSELSDAVKRDIVAAREYWASKEGKVEKAFTTMNDSYLKFNNQTDGVRSYNGIVKLLLAEYKEEKID